MWWWVLGISLIVAGLVLKASLVLLLWIAASLLAVEGIVLMLTWSFPERFSVGWITTLRVVGPTLTGELQEQRVALERALSEHQRQEVSLEHLANLSRDYDRITANAAGREIARHSSVELLLSDMITARGFSPERIEAMKVQLREREEAAVRIAQEVLEAEAVDRQRQVEMAQPSPTVLARMGSIENLFPISSAGVRDDIGAKMIRAAGRG